MRRLWWIGVSLGLALPVSLVLALCLALETQPRVQRTTTFTPEHIAQARHLLAQHDPRLQQPGILHTVTLSEAQVDVLAQYLAQQYGAGSAQVALQDDAARLSASLPLPGWRFYVNVAATLHSAGVLPYCTRLRLGRLPIPAWLANWALHRVLQHWQEYQPYILAREALQRVDLSGGKLTVLYVWRANMLDKMRAALIPPEEQARLRAYHDTLVQVTRTLPRRPSLTALLPALFSRSLERGRSGDPIAENRAVLLMLTLYSKSHSLATLVPAAQAWPPLLLRVVTLNARDDLAKHFVLSAALAAHVGVPLADAIGLYKEVEDARGGSGFSFNDLAADRAGTRFGQLAVHSQDTARRLQQRLSVGVQERDIMPATADLPEFMPEAEFIRRFGGGGAPADQAMLSDIERRLAALPLYR